MKKKNGFTLIELLASVTVLIIIVLIAVPTITRISNETKKRSFESSAHGIIKAGELYYSRREMMGQTLEYTSFKFPNNIYGLEFNGDVPKSGSMKIDEDGNIELAISDGKYCATKQYDDAKVTITKDTKNCDLGDVLLDLATTSESLGITSVNPCAKRGAICNFTRTEPIAFAIQVNSNDIYKFYVIADDGNKITLMMSEDLVEDVIWVDDCYSQDSSSVCADYGPTTALHELDTATRNWSNVPARAYTYSGLSPSGYRFYEDITRTMRARMVTYEELKNDSICHYLSGCPTWVAGNHWTSTVNSRVNAYGVAYINGNWELYAYPFDYSVDNYHFLGIRPVIELSK